jgi:hypothetical protein
LYFDGEKQMKKQLIIGGIAIMLLFVGLSGCSENGDGIDNGDSRFVGKWGTEPGTNKYFFTFFSDGTGSFIERSIEWNINDTKLVIISVEETLIYDFKFSDNDKTLTLVDVESGIPYVFFKQ